MGQQAIEFTDRYQALGLPRPDPQTMCDGQCEGIGCYPCKNDGGLTPIELAQWADAHDKRSGHEKGECDGWHFITCPDCGGTGRRAQCGN